MDDLLFATTNQGKLDEARAVLQTKVEGIPLDIPEIQSLDPVAVAVAKAQAYFEKINKPLFVEDVSLSFSQLNGLPGPYIDAFMKACGNEGIVEMLPESTDRKAVAQTTIVYIWGSKEGECKVFIGKMEGVVAEKPLGENGFGWDPIFIPDGETRTLAQLTGEEKNKYSMRAKALILFKNWINSR